MSRVLRAFLSIITVGIISGCATSWQMMNGTAVVESKYGYSYVAPSGWYLAPGRATDGQRRFTRDGSSLQLILSGRIKHKKAFEAQEKDSSPDMLPQELAENYIAELKASFANDTIEVLSNEPAQLGGQPGIRLVIELKTDAGLRYRSVHYAATTQAGLYLLRFSAPVLHFFDRYVDDFEQSVPTFRTL